MATYGSYKKVRADQFLDDSVTADNLQPGAGHRYCTLLVYNARGFSCHACANAGDCCCQACGRCCQWTVPANVASATFEIWSGGGGGPGNTCCNCCSHAWGGAGGNYAVRTVATTPGNTYTVCAGGSWPCSKSHTCTAGQGCRSFVTGTGLSNFCVTGGCGGFMCNGDDFGPREHRTCANCNICGMFGSDFGMMGTTGYKMGHGLCQCHSPSLQWGGTAPGIGKLSVNIASEYWCSCACYINWPSGGGFPGVGSYCETAEKCCAGGGMGGSGIVKVTYV